MYLRLQNVGVDFNIYGAEARSLKNAVLHASTGGQLAKSAEDRTIVRALNNVSLELREGARVGLIGGNGAGKTTLLRVMSGIYEPTRGIVEAQGQVVPFFGGRLGMDMDLPGYENIILRGMIMGFSRKEMQQRMEAIAAWTDLEDFLHLPVRTYSAGMRVRLAMAISTSVDADILLLDEGIGVGDAAFILKAQERLLEFVRRSGILVLATHSEKLMKRLCTEVIWMDHGNMRMFGPADEVWRAYRDAVSKSAA